MAAKRMSPHVDVSPRVIARFIIAYVVMLTVSCTPATNAFKIIPGVRGPEVTISLASVPAGYYAAPLATNPLDEEAAAAPFDIASLPALDAVTNPLVALADLPLTTSDGAVAQIPQGQPVGPLPDFRQARFDPGPAVSALAFRGQSGLDSFRAQQCLAAAIYYEAASESEDGQRAVAQVVLNRVRHPAYPNSVCGVVYQGTERGDRLCQFSFACDGSMARTPSSSGWATANRIARLSLAGYAYTPVGAATHYHTLAVNPYWNKSLTAVGVIGAHIFYRWGGNAGKPSAFYARYNGSEPIPGPKTPLYLQLRRQATPPVTPYPGITAGTIGTNATIAGATAPLPVPAPNASVAAIQASQDQSILAKQAALAQAQAARQASAQRKQVADDNRYVTGSLPESDVRPEYQGSGQWIGK
jgi:Cell Wall Hydrolase